MNKQKRALQSRAIALPGMILTGPFSVEAF
jgi:hypothetical protein